MRCVNCDHKGKCVFSTAVRTGWLMVAKSPQSGPDRAPLHHYTTAISPDIMQVESVNLCCWHLHLFFLDTELWPTICSLSSFMQTTFPPFLPPPSPSLPVFKCPILDSLFPVQHQVPAPGWQDWNLTRSFAVTSTVCYAFRNASSPHHIVKKQLLQLLLSLCQLWSKYFLWPAVCGNQNAVAVRIFPLFLILRFDVRNSSIPRPVSALLYALDSCCVIDRSDNCLNKCVSEVWKHIMVNRVE